MHMQGRLFMLERRIVFEIHRLKDMGFSIRQIARDLGLGRRTVVKYISHPEKTMRQRKRKSKLDPYKPVIDKLFEEHPGTPGTVVLNHLRKQGYNGGITIMREYLADGTRLNKGARAFIRFESLPGHQMQVDWGHFGSLDYGNTKRKLYAFAITESYSRILYVEFTHSQKQAVLHQCLLNAFAYFNGMPGELVVDNMLTAVTERDGRAVRFNSAFLDFLRPLKINPYACNVRQPQEKGKIERSVKYLRQNFWPLREIKNLFDANTQVRKWLDETANVRIHGTTGEKPVDRFLNVKLKPLPENLPESRDTVSVNAHKDFSVRYDNNFYTVPPWAVGKRLTLKACNKTVCVFYKDKTIAVHDRCWEHNKRIENPNHAEQVKRLKNKLFRDRDIAFFASLGAEAQDYLEAIIDFA